MPEPPEVEELVEAARGGDAAAWDALVDRYLPLVTAVIRRLRLSPADADDVNQTVWLRLVEHLDGLREPRALPGWLATTARNEGLRQIKRRARDLPVDPGGTTFDTRRGLRPGRGAGPGPAVARPARGDDWSSRRSGASCCSCSSPTHPLSYDEISARLGIPRGSIGPTRARALEQLRESRALRGWADEAPVSKEVLAMSSSTDDDGLMEELARAMAAGGGGARPPPRSGPRRVHVAHHRRGAAGPDPRLARARRRRRPRRARRTHARLRERRTVAGDRGRRRPGVRAGARRGGRRGRRRVRRGRLAAPVPVDSSGIFSVVVPAGPVRFGVRVDGVLRRTPWIVLAARASGPAEAAARTRDRVGRRTAPIRMHAAAPGPRPGRSSTALGPGC